MENQDSRVFTSLYISSGIVPVYSNIISSFYNMKYNLKMNILKSKRVHPFHSGPIRSCIFPRVSFPPQITWLRDNLLNWQKLLLLVSRKISNKLYDLKKIKQTYFSSYILECFGSPKSCWIRLFLLTKFLAQLNSTCHELVVTVDPSTTTQT